MGHCHRGEVRRLIEAMIAKGDQCADLRTRGDIHVLAARCALSAVVLEEEIREQIADRIRALIPPPDDTAAAKLTSLGSYVLSLVPGPEGLTDREARAVVQVIRDVGGLASLPLLRRFAGHPSRDVRGVLLTAWPRHPAEEYAREVLSHVPLHDAQIIVVNRAEAAALRYCVPLGHVMIDMPISGTDLAKLLPEQGIHALTLIGNSLLGDLSFARKLSGLTALALTLCPRVRSFSALEGLPLTSLRLELNEIEKSELGSLQRLDRLTDLSLDGTLFDSSIPLPSGHPTVERLQVSSPTKMMINDLSQWPALRELAVHGDCHAHSLLLAASRAPSLSSLEFSITSLHLPRQIVPPAVDKDGRLRRRPRELEPLPTIRSLTLREVSRGGSTRDLARVFPNLTFLALEYAEDTALDLTPLRHHAGLSIVVNGRQVQPEELS